MKAPTLLGIFMFLSISGPQLGAAQGTWVRVTDASQIAYQTSGAYVYLRNLNTFDPNAQGCCYSYWIDTSTPEGKNIFAIFLQSVALQQGIWIGLPAGYASGPVTYSGNW